MHKKFFQLLTVLSLLGFASTGQVFGNEADEGPWFTGPLLTPSARVLPCGHVNIEPYLFWNVTNGRYDDHWKEVSTPTINQINLQMPLKIGIYDRLAFSMTPQSFLTYTGSNVTTNIGDLPIGFEYQLYEGHPESWLTHVKLNLTEVLPTGRYQDLDPNLNSTDASGQGCYVTNLGLTLGKLIKIAHARFLSLRCNFTASISSSANVRGISIFGGDNSTRGRIFPGTSFIFLAGAEYTLVKEISLACDFQAFYSPKAHFKGRTIVPVTQLESIQFSLAPAIEYNWNSSMGIIIGSWFSFAGKNAGRFINGVFAFNYSY